MDFTGKVALVTGGGQGIGKTIALDLARLGADVAIGDVNTDAAAVTKKEIEALGRKSECYKLDVSSHADAATVINKVVEDLGSIDILINNAGITRDGLMLRMKEADWDLVMNINLKGAFNCIQAAVKHMSKKRYGRIVNIASIVGQIGNAGQANYAASKAGMIGLTKTVAKEFAGRTITCNAVAPGFIETAMTDALPEKAKEALISGIPMATLGSAGDVSKGVLFLASDDAKYVTGQVLAINGGMAM